MKNGRFCLLVVFIVLVWMGGIVQAMEPIPMGLMKNSNTYLEILTYDGSNQLTHPCVLYREDGWNGYTYIMAMTPLAYWDAAFENPSMRYSNDGIIWVQIPGQPDPILPQPRPGFYSDVSIELVDNTLYLFYRWAETMPENSLVYYRYTTTTDGVDWTTPVQTNLPPTRSNSFIYNGTGWESWGHTITGSTTVFEHFTSADAITWDKSGLISLDTSTFTPWHSEVKKYDNKYMLLMSDSDVARDLRFFTSDDGLAWNFENDNLPVLYGRPGMWDSGLYKTSFVEMDNTYKVWYAAFNDEDVSKVGYTQYPDISGIIPVAKFTANPKTGTAPHTVFFTDTSSGFVNPVTYLWDFGDGETSPVQHPSHEYTTVGIYSVNLTVTDQVGGSDFEYKSNYITVNEITPILTVTASPTTVTAGTPTGVTFTVKNATSNQVVSGALVTLSGGLATGSSITVADGTAIISVTASGAGTIMATASKTGYISGTTDVTANAATPVASFTPSVTSGTAPLDVEFTDTSANTPTTWSWSFRNVTGNNTRVVFSTLPDPVHTFGIGNYSIVLDASNSAGHGISTQDTFINVSALILPPVASFTPSATSGTAPLDVEFTDTSANTPTTWSWSFRNVTGNNTRVVFSTLPDPVHTFGIGNYSIVLDASNSAGHGISTQVTFINVTSVPSANPTTMVGVFMDGGWWLDANGVGIWDTGDEYHMFGSPGVQAVTGDWNHDGKDEMGVFLNGGWWLDANGDGIWNTGDVQYTFGSPGVQAVTGVWNLVP